MYVVYPIDNKHFRVVKVGTSKLSHTEHNQRYQTCYCHTISFKVLITSEQFGRNENENYAKAIAAKRIKLETIFKDLVSRFYINSRFLFLHAFTSMSSFKT